MSFDSRKYIDEYQKKNYKRVVVRVKQTDSDVLDMIHKQDNTNEYILNLIRNDIDVYPIIKIKNLIKPILAKRNIKDVYLFGSYARGQASKDSDVDIYCERGNVKGAIDVATLIEELEECLHKKVDLIFSSATLDKTFEKSMKEDLIKLC